MKKRMTIVMVTGLLGLGVAAGLPALGAQEANPMDVARQLNRAFIQVAEQVSPSVVVIDVSRRAAVSAMEESNPLWEWLPPQFRRQFEREGGGEPGRAPLISGQGSGVVIREDGFILTNSHVVEGAERIRVRFLDGREFTGEIRGVDAQSDLAVVKIEATGLPAAKFADSDRVQVGEFAVAIGAPFDLEYSVTFGHVSAKGRSRVIPDPAMDQDFIQTDANINPGNSGGPLVNIEGEVIGINTLIRGLRTGIGFAIPSNLAQEVAGHLIERGRFARAWLGIEIRALRDYAEYQALTKDVQEGVVVVGILRDGPSAKSELRLGDVITAVGDRAVTTAQELRTEVRSKPVGRPLDLHVVRANQKIVVRVTPEEWPEDTVPAAGRPAPGRADEARAAGMTLQPLTRELARQYDLGINEGLVVTAVEPGSVAARSGMRVGDVISEIDGQKVTTLREYRAAMRNADLELGVMVNIVRSGVNRFMILKDSGE